VEICYRGLSATLFYFKLKAQMQMFRNLSWNYEDDYGYA